MQRKKSKDELAHWAAEASLEQDLIIPSVQNPISSPSPSPEEEMEFWMEDAEGAYRVSEVGSMGKLPTTVAEARQHTHWELFRKAMEEEIVGKMGNQAWKVVRRPPGIHVLKSRWVFLHFQIRVW